MPSEQSSDDTEQPQVTITWNSLGAGQQSEQIPLSEIKNVEVEVSGGSSNPFRITFEGCAMPWWCRSIEWPEGRYVNSATDRDGGDE